MTSTAQALNSTTPPVEGQHFIDDLPPSPFSLAAVTSSKGFSPQKIVVYGVPGVGKSTFAATFPSPIFLRTEDGAGALDVPTFPKVAESTAEVWSAIDSLRREQHPYKTLVIDSLDWMEPLVWERVCQQHKMPNIEAFGYGKGYIIVDQKWRSIQAALDNLRTERKMHIVCIAHAVPQTYDPPDSDPYQRYSLKLNKRAAAIWMEWAEMTLFLNYRASISRAEGAAKAKAKGTGERVIYTQERPAYQAKSRWPLPDEIYIGNDPTWAAFHEALTEASEGGYHA